MLGRIGLIGALVSIGLSTSYARIHLHDPNTLYSGNPSGIPAIVDNPRVTTYNDGYIVDINTPGSDGVSYNTYYRFNIDKPTILNNSAKESKNTILGDVAGNANLQQGSEAGVILNQIYGGGPRTTIDNAIEVAGRKADVVIANQYGISVEYDAKFINTNSVTLVTGYAILDDQKALLGYGVNPNISPYTNLAVFAYLDPDVNLNVVGNNLDLIWIDVRNLNAVVGVDRVDAQLNPIFAPISPRLQRIRPILYASLTEVAETISINGIGLANIEFYDDVTAKNLLVRNVREVVNNNTLSISDNIEIYNVDSFRNNKTINAKNFTFKGNNFTSRVNSTLNITENIDIDTRNKAQLVGAVNARNIKVTTNGIVDIERFGNTNIR